MDHSKLFRVLVLGGAVLGAGCVENASPTRDEDAAAHDGGADASLTECGFCPNAECCETDESGASHTRDGLVCCWGTSC